MLLEANHTYGLLSEWEEIPRRIWTIALFIDQLSLESGLTRMYTPAMSSDSKGYGVCGSFNSGFFTLLPIPKINCSGPPLNGLASFPFLNLNSLPLKRVGFACTFLGSNPKNILMLLSGS